MVTGPALGSSLKYRFPWSPDKTFLRFAWRGDPAMDAVRANVRARWKEDPSKAWQIMEEPGFAEADANVRSHDW